MWQLELLEIAPAITVQQDPLQGNGAMYSTHTSISHDSLDLTAMYIPNVDSSSFK